MLKWIFFDITGTLLDSGPFMSESQNYILEALIEQGKDITKDEFDAVAEDLKKRKVPSVLGGLIKHYTDSGDEYAVIYDRYYHRIAREFVRLLPPVPGVLDAVKNLSEKYSLGIIANQIGEVREALKEHGILEYFEVIVLSGEEEVSKPDPAIFRLALERARCEASEAVMIGDRWDTDVKPALEAGMRGILFSTPGSFFDNAAPEGDLKPERTIKALAELIEFL